MPEARDQRWHALKVALEVWRMEVSEAKRCKALEAENAKLKKILAQHMLDVATLKEMLGKKTAEAPCKATSCGLGHDREELQPDAGMRLLEPILNEINSGVADTVTALVAQSIGVPH